MKHFRIDITEIDTFQEYICVYVTKKNDFVVNLSLVLLDIFGNVITFLNLLTIQAIKEQSICLNSFTNVNMRGGKILLFTEGDPNYIDNFDFLPYFSSYDGIKINKLKKLNDSNWQDDWEEMSLISSHFKKENNYYKFTGI